MPTLSSAGIGSGLDINGLVSSLVNAETTPIAKRLNTKEAAIQGEISSLGAVKSALSQVQSAIAQLKNMDNFQGRTTNVSSPNLYKVTASNDADVATYSVLVNNLSAAQSLATAAFTNVDTVVGTGTLTFTFGTYNSTGNTFTPNPDTTVNQLVIDSNNNSVSAIRDAVNGADIGIIASIVNDGTGARLVFTSENSGASNGLQITVSNDADGNDLDNAGLSQLAFDPTATVADGQNLTQTIAPADALIQINGIPITSSSNVISTAIDGLTISLVQADPTTTSTLSVNLNTSNVIGLVTNFVANFNGVLTGLNTLTAYNPETKESGLLQGDAGIRLLKSQLRNLIGNPVSLLSGDITSLIDIGIKTDSIGNLVLDNAVLNTALNSNFDEIGRLFAFGGYTSDPQIEVSSIDPSISTGVYNINLTSYDPETATLAGSIGAFAASSPDGIELQGTGGLLGLNLSILGGTTGARGDVTIFSGIADQLDKLLNNYASSTGILQSRTTSLNSNLKDINSQREALDYRADKIRARYLHQFIALDSLLAQLGQTSSFLSEQLRNLPSARMRE